jgi:DNA uptake protein ComE-like DNA-binding protein
MNHHPSYGFSARGSWQVAAGASRGTNQRGSALLLVLFTILLISSLIISAVEFVRHDVDEYAVLNRRFQSRVLAQSGVAFALAPQVRNEDRDLLEQTGNNGGRFRVLIASESAHLNINFVLETNRDYLLQTLFRKWGLTSREIDPAIAGLHHFIEDVSAADDASELQAPLASTPVSAPNAASSPNPTIVQGTTQTAPATPAAAQQQFRPFQAVEEMSLVPEFAPVMKRQPDWAQSFTVYGDGKIDVNTADEDMIQLVTGVTPTQANQFVKYRWGRDGIPYTADDQIYRSLEEVRVHLGMSPQQFQAVQDMLALTSAVDRIESSGMVADFTTNITAIVNRNAVPVQILVWQER